MGRNHPAGASFVDCSRLEEGIQVSYHRRGHGNMGKKVRKGKVHQPTASEGQILSTGMHGSESKMGPRVFGPHSLSREPARVTVTVGNTIFGACTREQEVDWALVIWDAVRRLLTGVSKSKPTPTCPYLLHLYIAHDVVQADDKKVYIVGESFMRHEVDLDEEEESSGSESSKRESLTSKEIWELQQQKKKKEASPPRRKVIPTYGRKNKAPQVEERLEELRKKNPFQVIADSLNEIRE